VARQARQICRGTRRLNPGDGAVLRHRPGCLGKGIITELIFAPGQRPKCGRALVPQESGAHTGNDVELLQTPAARETADKRVKLSAEASHAVTGIRSASHPHAVRARCGRHAPGATAPMTNETAPHGDHFKAPAMNGSQPAPVRQEPIKKPCRRRIRKNASLLFRGVTTPDLPEGI
jgi:hypothetical protein